MLDAIRYMIVWNPLIFLLFTVLAKMFPHHHVTRHVAVAAQGLAAAKASPSVPLSMDAVDMAGVAAGAH